MDLHPDSEGSVSINAFVPLIVAYLREVALLCRLFFLVVT